MPSSADHEPLAIQALILERCRALGLSRVDVVQRAGFRNIPKGLRRLDELCFGELYTTRSLIKGLPTALEVAPEVVADAVQKTKQQVDDNNRKFEEEQDAKWRATFKACAWLLGTYTKPSQIVAYGFSGGPDRWLKIPLDTSLPAVTFAKQALKVVRVTPLCPFHGKTVGYVVNYTPGHAVQFDLEGNPVALLERAYRPGQVVLQLGGKKLTADQFTLLLRMGTGEKR
jgi:hypothetical protein